MLLLHVETFLAIVRAGSLTRAAETLFITQPTLTERLQLLEVNLGATLFTRSPSRGLILTEAGRAFLPHAERIIRAASEGVDAIAFANTGTRPALVVGVAQTVGMTRVEQSLASYRKVSNGPVRVRTGSEEQIVDMVLNGDIEVGIAHAVRHADIQVTSLYADEIVLVAARAHPLATRRSVRMSDLVNVQLIHVAHTLMRQYSTNLPDRSDSAPGLVEVDSVELAKLLVARGVGASFLPMTEVAERIADGSLVRLNVSDASPPRTKVTALQRTEVPFSDALTTFFGFLRTTDVPPAGGRSRATRSARASNTDRSKRPGRGSLTPTA
jgi:DNA-binding transcriptional LysR family regulator